MLRALAPLLILLATTPACTMSAAQAQDAPQPPDPRMLQVDRQKREVRVRCQALRVEMPLEFFCVLTGTADHEAVLRTVVKPSAIHAALLGLGLEPGHPLRFEPERKQWIAPAGPPVRIEVEWEENGQTIRRRAGELMRNMKSGDVMPPGHWVFSGSALGPNGEYGADFTGQLVSIVNFEYTTLDVPRIASNANETLEWETNHDLMPPEGTEVWMVIAPVEGPATREADRAAEAAPAGAPLEIIVVMLDQAGGVMVSNDKVALGEAGAAVRARMTPASQVRLSAPRGAPVDDLGRLLGELVRAEITNVTFVPPPPAMGEAADEQKLADAEFPLRGKGRVESAQIIEVHDGGREVSVEGRRMPVGTFVQELRQKSPLARGGGERPAEKGYVIKPAEGADDLLPVDFAAVHAALYVLGFEVSVEAPGYGPATRPANDVGQNDAAGAGAAGANEKLAELRRRWEEQVLPQASSMQRAAQTHYEVIEAYQREINRLLDEVERLRREMDLLQQRYNELTAPKPGS